MGHWPAQGMGHGAWGIGPRRAWGMGHGALARAGRVPYFPENPCILKKLITADRQLMKLSIVVPEAIDKPENWRSFLKTRSAS
ncbi:hypothetical protein [Microcoleus sp. B7-D4]|uniref:hypothetical protein n=1 Tax=Microcoleus sp. B7-D4 TaxID=2818696 RepID=UPI002FD655D5